MVEWSWLLIPPLILISIYLTGKQLLRYLFSQMSREPFPESGGIIAVLSPVQFVCISM